jgi:hypothetical protein
MPNRFLEFLPLIQDQTWKSVNGWIRNANGECPVCAIVNVLSKGKTSYTTQAQTAWISWHGANSNVDIPDLVQLVITADDRVRDEMYSSELRKQLEDILKPKHV